MTGDLGGEVIARTVSLSASLQANQIEIKTIIESVIRICTIRQWRWWLRFLWLCPVSFLLTHMPFNSIAIYVRIMVAYLGLGLPIKLEEKVQPKHVVSRLFVGGEIPRTRYFCGLFLKRNLALFWFHLEGRRMSSIEFLVIKLVITSGDKKERALNQLLCTYASHSQYTVVYNQVMLSFIQFGPTN